MTDPPAEICSTSVHLPISGHAKVNGITFRRNPSRSPVLPALRCTLSANYSHWYVWCWPCTGSWHQGNCSPWSRRERLTVTSLHCMAAEVTADLFTGSLMVPALSSSNLYLEILHETIQAMRVVGRPPALWSTQLCKHLQWALTYLIFKLDCPTAHRGTRCEKVIEKLGSIH